MIWQAHAQICVIPVYVRKMMWLMHAQRVWDALEASTPSVVIFDFLDFLFDYLSYLKILYKYYFIYYDLFYHIL